MSSEGGKKKPSPFGDAKPREENIDPEHEERLSKKFEQIDAERTTLLTKPAPTSRDGSPQMKSYSRNQAQTSPQFPYQQQQQLQQQQQQQQQNYNQYQGQRFHNQGQNQYQNQFNPRQQQHQQHQQHIPRQNRTEQGQFQFEYQYQNQPQQVQHQQRYQTSQNQQNFQQQQQQQQQPQQQPQYQHYQQQQQQQQNSNQYQNYRNQNNQQFQQNIPQNQNQAQSHNHNQSQDRNRLNKGQTQIQNKEVSNNNYAAYFAHNFADLPEFQDLQIRNENEVTPVPNSNSNSNYNQNPRPFSTKQNGTKQNINNDYESYFASQGLIPVNKEEEEEEEEEEKEEENNNDHYNHYQNESNYDNNNNSSHGYQRFENQRSKYSSVPPPEFVCKLCETPGHWLEDCQYFKPKGTRQYERNYGEESGRGSMGRGMNRRNQFNHEGNPPDSYTCRLCNTKGHWIEHCAQFQPQK